MKLTITMLLSIVFFSCTIIKPRYSPNNEKKDDYKIINIDSIENYYLIYVQRSDSVFKILSKSDSVLKGKCKRIKVGDEIHLNLKTYFGNRNKDFINAQLLHISGMKIGSIIVRIDEKGIVHDLFYDERLVGLCIKK